jgi:hypothetical protein
MKTTLLLVLVCFANAGCTTLNAEDCRTMDWFRLGARDGETNSNLISRYAGQCAPAGVTPDAAQYAKGRIRGLWVRQKDHLLYTP